MSYFSSNCRTYQVSFDNCTSCPYAKLLNSTQNRCSPCSSHCISCNSNLSCIRCQSGYIYNQINIRMPIPMFYYVLPCSTRFYLLSSTNKLYIMLTNILFLKPLKIFVIDVCTIVINALIIQHVQHAQLATFSILQHQVV